MSHTGDLVPTLSSVFHYYRDTPGSMDAALLRLLTRAEADPWLAAGTTLVFCASDDEADRVRGVLAAEQPGWRAACLHGGTAAADLYMPSWSPQHGATTTNHRQLITRGVAITTTTLTTTAGDLATSSTTTTTTTSVGVTIATTTTTTTTAGY